MSAYTVVVMLVKERGMTIQLGKAGTLLKECPPITSKIVMKLNVYFYYESVFLSNESID